MPQLTELSIRNLKPPPLHQKIYFDKTLPGFGVRVTKSGVKTFVLLQGKKRQKIPIGRYPIISLAEARAKAKVILAEKTLGHYQQKTITFADARDLFISHSEKNNRASTAKEYKRLLHRLSFFTLQIRPLDISKELATIKYPSERNHVLTALKAMLTFAVNQGYLNANPALSMPLPSKRTPRARTLSKDELKRLLKAIAASPLPFHRIILLCLLLGQRRGEIAHLRAEYIDRVQQTITLPPTLTKNGKEHTIPYGSVTVQIIDQLPTEGYLFPAAKGINVFNSWGKSKSALDEETGLKGYVIHDLRRTFASLHAELATPLHVIERLLNHTGHSFAGIVSTYNRFTYFPEMSTAVTAYENFIFTIINTPS